MLKLNLLLSIDDFSVFLNEKKILNFFLWANCLYNDNLVVSKNFFSHLIDEQDFCSFLYNTKKIGSEATKLLISFFSKYIHDEIDEGEFLLELKTSSIIDPKGIVYIEKNAVTEQYLDKCVGSQSEYLSLKRFYVRQASLELLTTYLPECFPYLLFNQEEKSLNFKGYTQENLEEIFRILCFLDECGMKEFEACNRDAGATLKRFESNGFICSGGQPIKIDCLVNGKRETLNCTPHFKIESAYSNKRLYFAWGNDKNGQIIVIGKIGGHE